MSASVIRTLGVSSATQSLLWTYGNGVTVRAYCWGGGGGGGGNDSATGGTGAGGGFGYNEFTVNNGDIIDVAVGAAGSAGASGSTGSGGGSAGAGYLGQEIFNTRTNQPGGWTTPVNSSYSQFLNTFGIWPDSYSIGIDYTWNITTTGGPLMFQAAYDTPSVSRFVVDADTPRLIVSIDGVDSFFVVPQTNYYGFLQFNFNTVKDQTMNYNVTLSSGTHTVRVRSHPNNQYRVKGAGSFAMRIAEPIGSFSGGRGGNAGYSGYSGAGGGGGGATTIYLNGTLIACGGGGGGGGGGGNGPVGSSAPGASGQAVIGTNSGQNGYNKNGDGGGGGGGGGGYGGGEGGQCPGGDIGGGAGSNGGSYGLSTASSTGQAPAGSTAAYYTPQVGRGGNAATSGNGGACVMEFFVSGINVNTASGWQPVQQTWIKSGGTWRPMQAGWIKVANSWQYFINSFAPVFTADPNTWGVNSRVAPENQGDPSGTPPDFGIGPDYGGSGGGDGGKVICTELYHQGLLDQTIYQLDQEFGRWLLINQPTTYWGYRAWADILVRYMRGQGRPLIAGLAFWLDQEQKQQLSKKIAVAVAKVIAKPFANELARRADKTTKRPFYISGWLVVTLGLPICKAIGYFAGKNKKIIA